MEGVYPKTPQFTESEAEVKLFVLEQNLLLILVQQGENQAFDNFFSQYGHVGGR